MNSSGTGSVGAGSDVKGEVTGSDTEEGRQGQNVKGGGDGAGRDKRKRGNRKWYRSRGQSRSDTKEGKGTGSVTEEAGRGRE